ncbi:NUDIX hydrolase [Streptosporangium roseum]|uniref:NUDIX hydrolase n=1 Tax=Streptosporangium roseum TaxID=2001 RepID=UPI003AFA5124
MARRARVRGVGPGGCPVGLRTRPQNQTSFPLSAKPGRRRARRHLLEAVANICRLPACPRRGGWPRCGHAGLDRAAIAAVADDQNRVLLMWRHRFLADRWGWELPGGLIDVGEDAMATAAREHISPPNLSDNSEVEHQRQAAGLGDQMEPGGESASGPFTARPCRSARLVTPRRIIQPLEFCRAGSRRSLESAGDTECFPV